MSHQDRDRVSPAPPGGWFLAAIVVRAARKAPLLWVLLAGLAMPLVFLPAQSQHQTQPQTGLGSLAGPD